jgi:hypothetical protein
MKVKLFLIVINFIFITTTYAQIPDNNLVLWLDADSVQLIDNKVATWYDVSGSDHNLTQASTSWRPSISSFNSNPLVSFNGNAYFQINFGETFAQPNTIFVVYRIRSAATMAFIFDEITATRTMLYWNANLMVMHSGLNLTYSKSSPTSLTLSTLIYNSSSSSFRENGSVKSIGNAGTNSITGLTIGTRYTAAANYLTGDIAEFIFYNRALNSDEISIVEDYLMDKYSPPIDLGSDLIIDYGLCDTILSID